MTTAILDREPGAAPTPATSSRPGLTFGRILDAEWTKIRTVRSTVWNLIALVTVSVGGTALVCWGAASELASNENSEPVGAFLTWGLLFGQIAALVLGILAATSEYSSGMIRTTLAAVPRRSSVLVAKAAVLGGILLVLGVATTFASYLAGNFFLDREGVGMAIDEPGVLRTIVGGGLYLAMLGVFGLALGTLIRHTAGAVTVGIAVIFVIGNLIGLVPGAVGEWLEKLMPGNAGQMVAVVEWFDPDALDPWVGFAVFSAETLVLLAIAGLLFNRRDA